MEPAKPRVERQVAKKFWIREILDGEITVTEGLQPNILQTARGEAGRVNVIGVVVQTQELPTATLVLDDSTGTISIRSFDRPLHFTVGDFVQVIGRPRVYQREPYVAAEAVARVPAGWAAYRRSEIGEPRVAEPKPVEVPVVAERETNAERLIKLIIQLDRGDGAAVEDVIMKSRIKDAESILEQLLLAGDIFELRPGKVKVL